MGKGLVCAPWAHRGALGGVRFSQREWRTPWRTGRSRTAPSPQQWPGRRGPALKELTSKWEETVDKHRYVRRFDLWQHWGRRPQDRETRPNPRECSGKAHLWWQGRDLTDEKKARTDLGTGTAGAKVLRQDGV